jgi:hypothetical protein
MKQHQRSESQLERDKIDFIIPDCDQVTNFVRRERRRLRQCLHEKVKLKDFIKRRFCSSLKDIINKGFNQDGEVIIVNQWEYTYKVTHRSRSGIEKTTVETSTAFAYISYKYLQAYQWIYENEIEKSSEGLCLSIDFVHNLFRTRLALGTYGIPVLVTHSENNSIIINNNNDEYNVFLFNYNYICYIIIY